MNKETRKNIVIVNQFLGSFFVLLMTDTSSKIPHFQPNLDQNRCFFQHKTGFLQFYGVDVEGNENKFKCSSQSQQSKFSPPLMLHFNIRVWPQSKMHYLIATVHMHSSSRATWPSTPRKIIFTGCDVPIRLFGSSSLPLCSTSP